MRKAELGFSLVETTIALTAVALLTAAVAPSASRAVDRARLARAVDDMEAIKTAIFNYRDDVFQGFTEDGTTSGDLVEMLVSDGDTPVDATLTDDNGAVAGSQMRWDDPVGDNDGTPGITVDFLEGHLVTNNILQGAASYNAVSGGNRWRGAYLNAPVDPDPWGNRYAAVTAFLDAPGNTIMDSVVLSVGPDETINSLWEKDGNYPLGDDIMITILRDRNLEVP